jgi:hypothetical protein
MLKTVVDGDKSFNNNNNMESNLRNSVYKPSDLILQISVNATFTEINQSKNIDSGYGF